LGRSFTGRGAARHQIGDEDGAIAQLRPGLDGVSRWPATEILIATDAARALIRKGDDHQLRSQLSTGRAEGMMTMEQSLADLVRTNRIARDTAFAHCFRNDDLQRYLV